MAVITPLPIMGLVRKAGPRKPLPAQPRRQIARQPIDPFARVRLDMTLETRLFAEQLALQVVLLLSHPTRRVQSDDGPGAAPWERAVRDHQGPVSAHVRRQQGQFRQSAAFGRPDLGRFRMRRGCLLKGANGLLRASVDGPDGQRHPQIVAVARRTVLRERHRLHQHLVPVGLVAEEALPLLKLSDGRRQLDSVLWLQSEMGVVGEGDLPRVGPAAELRMTARAEMCHCLMASRLPFPGAQFLVAGDTFAVVHSQGHTLALVLAMAADAQRDVGGDLPAVVRSDPAGLADQAEQRLGVRALKSRQDRSAVAAAAPALEGEVRSVAFVEHFAERTAGFRVTGAAGGKLVRPGYGTRLAPRFQPGRMTPGRQEQPQTDADGGQDEDKQLFLALTHGRPPGTVSGREGRPGPSAGGAPARRLVEKTLRQANSVAKKGKQDLDADEEEWWDRAGGKILLRQQKEYPLLAAKAEAYLRLEKELAGRFEKDGLVPCPTLKPIPIFAGVSLRRVRYGELEERVVRWLRVRVLCRTEADCYRALGIVHELGKPVAYKYSEHFADYLASPKPNGYRALHTAIHYRPAAATASDGGLPVEFRILTPRMHLTNENGIFHDREIFKRGRRRRLQEVPGKSGFWWNHPKLCDIRDHLAAQDIGSQTEAGEIYVFTPQGEVRTLDDGSTALDFAYAIHSELGNHAHKIEVNGESAEYKKRLHNGDLVEVHYDPNFRGPDLAWKAFVTTDLAWRRIQQGEVQKARATHAGRALIEKHLLRALRWYEQHRHFEFHLGSERLDALLLTAARARGHPTLSDLYEALVSQPGRSADLVAGNLVTKVLLAELVPLLRTPAGQPLEGPPEAIRLCASCRPVPSDRCAVGLRHRHRNVFHLTVHRPERVSCLREATPDRRVPLCWVEDAPGKEEMILKVEGEDRHGFLGEVLRVVYDHPKVTIRKVEAEARETSGADLSLLLETEALDNFAPLRKGLENLPGIRHLSFLPLSPAQRLPALREPARVANPYTYDCKLDRSMFYDRQELLEDLTTWVQAESGTHRKMLLGSKRVGKTCLAHYFADFILRPRRLGSAVYVNFQGLSSFDTPSLVDYLTDRVRADLDLVSLPTGQARTPVERLSESLGLLAAGLPAGQRLLIMLDEINFFLDLPEDRFNPTAIDSLRYLITSRREVCWLLITQPLSGIEAARAARMDRLLVEFPPLKVSHLEPNWAEKLILEPMRRCGISYAGTPDRPTFRGDRGPVPAALIELTDGNPYLIQVFCYKLVEHVRSRRRTIITPEDLEQVVRQLLADEDDAFYLHHLTRLLPPKQRALLAALAGCEEFWTKEGSLLGRRPSLKLGGDDWEWALEELERQGLIATRGGPGERELRIPMGLLRRWARIHLSP